MLTIALTLCLTLALAANRHATPHTWARSLAPGLDMGALDHVESMIERVRNHATRHRRSVGFIVGCGVGAGQRKEAKDREGKSGELHAGSIWLCDGGGE
jgi:hypothetical protein